MSETEVTPDLLRSMPLPGLGGNPDKDSRGRVLIVGGSPEVPGAAVLAGIAALRTGAGKLQMAATAVYGDLVAAAVPEARVIRVPAARNGEIGKGAANALSDLVERSDAVVIGPGMLDDAAASALAATLVSARTARQATFVLDAGAITGLGGLGDRLSPAAGRMVLTPHMGEMAALSGLDKDEVEADPIAAARGAARRLGAVLVLKSATTHIVSPDGLCWIHEADAPGLATSGSGDVLAGVIGGLLARGAPPTTAAIWGVWLHGAAGRALAEAVGPLGFLAREILDQIPRVMASVSKDPRDDQQSLAR